MGFIDLRRIMNKLRDLLINLFYINKYDMKNKQVKCLKLAYLILVR